MKLYIGCDNIGFALKDKIVQYINANIKDVELIDCGCASQNDTTAYPLFAQKVCEGIISDNYNARGILVCGTGLGMCIAANKFKGIYATVCHDEYSCERSILSNNANVLCLGQRVISEFAANQIVEKWLSLNFVDSPSAQKIAIIANFEDNNMKGL